MRVLVLLAVAGCYAPSPPEGAPCAVDETCPAGLTCVTGVCVHAPPVVDAPVDPSCACSAGDTLSCGAAAPVPCALGCIPDAVGAHCGELVPSNGVDADAGGLGPPIAITGVATFDTDTGAITGALVRPAGEGVLANVRFAKATSGTAPLGVFTLHRLTVTSTGTVRFTGTRAAVLVIGDLLQVDGTIDASAGCYGADRRCGGPGGGTGGTAAATPATGCGPGGLGTTDPDTMVGADGGGGGGGAGLPGGIGGDGGPNAGGAAGAACLADTLEPLVGGSGGGSGGGPTGTRASGGGGGGALQLTALQAIAVTGTITVGGAGGAGGIAGVSTLNATAGGGGGAGGALLLEAPQVTLAGGTLAANGGGGGGGGQLSTAGLGGENGKASTTPARGGAGAGNAGDGGDGGARNAQAGSPADVIAPYNGGGGGGGVGRIYIRSQTPLGLSGTTSPVPGTGPVVTR